MTQPYHHGALRTALLEAAETIVERDGIAALTLRATAREAGVSHAAPSHHFGDLSGLLSTLAASGFMRLRACIEGRAATAAADPGARLIARGRGYVGFAQAHPGVFLLMFRSERLDWSAPALQTAGEAAFALLTQDEPEPDAEPEPQGVRNLVTAMTRWSLLHGLSTLLVDGRLGAMADKVPGVDIEKLIEAILTGGLQPSGAAAAATRSAAPPSPAPPRTRQRRPRHPPP